MHILKQDTVNTNKELELSEVAIRHEWPNSKLPGAQRSSCIKVATTAFYGHCGHCPVLLRGRGCFFRLPSPKWDTGSSSGGHAGPTPCEGPILLSLPSSIPPQFPTASSPPLTLLLAGTAGAQGSLLFKTEAQQLAHSLLVFS